MSRSAPPILRLYVIRHGETEWSLSGQHTGRADIPLTAQGEEDARELGVALRGIGFAHAFTSPRWRARRTAELVAPGPHLQIEPDLAEWGYGDYEGLTTEEILERRANWSLFRDGCPDGEQPDQVLARTEALIARLRRLHGNVALFTHGHFSSVLSARWIGFPLFAAECFELATASVAVLSYAAHHPQTPVIAQWNGRVGVSKLAEAQQTADTPPTPALDRWENDGGAIASPWSDARKRLIIFDLDGTLAESKAAIDAEMAALLGELLRIVNVAIISGGDWPQFQKQLVAYLPSDANLHALSLLPTCGTKFYRYSDDWELLYAELLTDAERAEIVDALESVVESTHSEPARTWEPVIEDRGSQITYSALGQAAPLADKQQWDPDFVKRRQMKALLEELIPEFSVRLGGTTSIDVTKPGIDKAYGIGKLSELWEISIEEMVFIGDALFPGGNDFPAREAGVDCIQVRDSHETKRLIEAILVCSKGLVHTTSDLKVTR